jgi:hypothetical protein
MSSLYSLAERTLKIAEPRLTTDTAVTMQEAILTIGTVRDKLIMNEAYAQRYAQETIEVEEILKTYGYDVDINPVYDVSRDMWKITLPAQPLDMPLSAGLRGISVRGGDNLSMVRLEPGSINMTRGMHSAALPRDAYHRELMELYFHQPMTEEMCMVMQIVPASKSLKSREEVPLTPAMEMDIVMQTSEFLIAVGAQAEDPMLDDNG